MRILVVGDGKVGHTVAEQLTREGHDVVIIDKNEDVLQRCEDTLDVLCIRGNGANARCWMPAWKRRILLSPLPPVTKRTCSAA